jgi:hypothetical protein
VADPLLCHGADIDILGLVAEPSAFPGCSPEGRCFGSSLSMKEQRRVIPNTLRSSLDTTT